MGARQRIVLYYPQSASKPEPPNCRYQDELPLSLLTIAAWPMAEGYTVELIDGSRFPAPDAHRRAVEACEGALLYGTTGILGPQVADALACTRAVKARHAGLPAFIGGWFASVTPELQLATGLYDAVALGQGEITFRELVNAVHSGEELESVAGLALLRDGEVVRTAPRAVVGWDRLLDCPWELLDIEAYRAPQLRTAARRPAERRFGLHAPRFQIPYFSSFGCPIQCTFCCSPEVSGLRWKAMPAERLLDDLCALQDRWGFDAVEFWDANFGVDVRRTDAFAQGLLERGRKLAWFAYVQSETILRAGSETLDRWAASGMYGAVVGGEAGSEDTMLRIRKPTRPQGNLAAARELDKRGILGYPGEDEASMLATLEEARAIAVECPNVRPEVWHYRPIPGTEDYRRALEEGYRPPTTLEEWGRSGDYWSEEPWPGRIPPGIERRRRLLMQFSSLAQGAVRQRIGWWEKRARRHLERESFAQRSLEAWAFHVYDRLRRIR
jgi:anaerobic magnesium-protoporphyrin IX monomethyl ester cyclase